VYTPPAGKAIVVTQVTYDLDSGTEGTESYVALHGTGDCSDTEADFGDSIHAEDAQSRTFPTGLPMSAVAMTAGGVGYAITNISGYLIPASQVPEPPVSRLRRGLKGGR
jgi:hypothetical protein